jgi:hypothetical protein
MKLLAAVAVITVGVSLGSCAGSNGAFGPARTLSLQQKKVLHLASVTAEAAPDVQMDKKALSRILDHLKNELRAEAPNVLAQATEPGDSPPLTLRVIFTQYAGGGAPAKFDRRSVGLIQIDADVLFVDPTGKTVAQSKVAEHFGSGGDAGLTTNILNVETDFAVAVAALVR